MRGTLDQGFWVTPFTAHLEIYGLCTNINTRCDLVIEGRLGASLGEWSSLLIFDDTGCRLGDGCRGRISGCGRPAGWCEGAGPRPRRVLCLVVLELVVPGLTVVEVAGVAVGVSTRARLSGPNKTVWARTEGALRHPPPPHPPGIGVIRSRQMTAKIAAAWRPRNNDTKVRCRRRIGSEWPSRGSRHACQRGTYGRCQ
jgi:hypothetical protein